MKNLRKSSYGKTWQAKSDDWYTNIYVARPLLHENFVDYLTRNSDVKTILEIGCGAGVYPIKLRELFSNKKYLGIDISEQAITYCKNHSQFDFICGDFLQIELPEKYDLVFSHAVVDHVYDIDLFLSKIVQTCRKHAYVSSYRGYFPNLGEHRMTWNNDEGCYYNDLSVNQIRRTLIQSGLQENEFTIRSQESGQRDKYLDGVETVIEISRK